MPSGMEKNMNKKQKKVLIRILVTIVLLVVLHFIPVEGYARMALYMIPYLVIGYDILRKALKGIKNRQVFDENFLMAVATVGAIALAVMIRRGLYRSGCSYAVLSDRRAVPELCRRKEPPQYQRTDGYPPGLRKYRKRRETGEGRSG